MSAIDLITRVDAIYKKYDKYDVDKQKDVNLSGDDAFARLYAAVETDIVAATRKSEAAATEKNRATAVAVNADIRRTKARLLDEIPKLQRLALKKVKGLSKEEFEARSDLVHAMKERIEGIPDGSTSAAKHTGDAWAASASHTGIKFESNYSDGRFNNEYFQHTEESDQFKQDYEMRKIKKSECTTRAMNYRFKQRELKMLTCEFN